MAGYNRIIIVGNLTRDPGLKQLASGQPVCQLGIASNRQYRNRQTGSLVQEVCFVDIDVFGPQAESCNQYLQKGRQVLVEGRLKFDSWETPEGAKRSKHTIVADRVVFLSSGAAESDGIARTESAEDDDLAKKLLADKPLESSSNAFVAAEKSVSTKEIETSKPDNTPPLEAKEELKENKSDDLNFKDEPPFQDDLPF